MDWSFVFITPTAGRWLWFWARKPKYITSSTKPQKDYTTVSLCLVPWPIRELLDFCSLSYIFNSPSIDAAAGAVVGSAKRLKDQSIGSKGATNWKGKLTTHFTFSSLSAISLSLLLSSIRTWRFIRQRSTRPLTFFTYSSQVQLSYNYIFWGFSLRRRCPFLLDV